MSLTLGGQRGERPEERDGAGLGQCLPLEGGDGGRTEDLGGAEVDQARKVGGAPRALGRHALTQHGEAAAHRRRVRGGVLQEEEGGQRLTG